IFSEPAQLHGETLIILENLKSFRLEKVGRLNMIEIHPKPLNKETCWNIARLLKLGVMISHSIDNLSADFDRCLNIRWRLGLWFRLVFVRLLTADLMRCKQQRRD